MQCVVSTRLGDTVQAHRLPSTRQQIKRRQAITRAQIIRVPTHHDEGEAGGEAHSAKHQREQAGPLLVDVPAIYGRR